METGMKVNITYKGRGLVVVFSSPYSVDLFDAQTNKKCLEFNQLERATIMRLAVEEMEFIEFKNRKVA